MSKHAYLLIITGHHKEVQFLLQILDDPRNDIFIHIDKKDKTANFNTYLNICKHSKVYFVKRRNVAWGSGAIGTAEMDLLKKAVVNNYDYYHLLSGTDLPVKSNDFLHNFFNKYNDKIFVECNNFLKNESEWKFNLRFQQYHLFQDWIGSKNNNLKRLDWTFCLIQKFFRINRTKKLHKTIKSGSTWFSIPNNFAHYLVQNYDQIIHFVKYTYCVDEIFIQTWLYNSKFYKNIFHNKNINQYQTNLRFYDFKNGHPRYMNTNDFKKLNKSKFLFARKFDVDKKPFLAKNIKKILNTDKILK